MKNQTTMIILLAAVAGGGFFLYSNSQKKAADSTQSSNAAEAEAIARAAEARAEESRQKTEQGRLSLAGLEAQLDSKSGSLLDRALGGAIDFGVDIGGQWAGSLFPAPLV